MVAEKTGSAVTVYFRALNLVYSLVGTTKNFYIFNGHGDVIALTNASGTTTRIYVYLQAFNNDKFPGLISVLPSNGNASSVPLKPTVDYIKNDPHMGNYFIKDGQLYCIELYLDRSHFSILKVDAETGNTEVVKQIQLPAKIDEIKYLPKASYSDDGLDILYLTNVKNVYYYLRVE